jgi:alkanesulfonate monooxygenase SsuD/methylene tetrahydromethanopterin reductase-like flavin-dependent oxidoreductase (luciferase family)
MGPKALARAAQWADGVNGFELAPGREPMDRYFRAAESAWAEAGRSSPPRLTTSAWFALGADGEERLRAYARKYLAFMGDEMAEGAAAMVRLDSGDTVRAALDEAAEAGCDEFMLVPTITDPTELDRVVEVVSAWRS